MLLFDAVVVADSPHADVVVLGLTLAERGRRVALASGARRVFTTGDLDAWDAERGDAGLLVIRAGDQLVHTPLVEAVLESSGDRRVAVDGDQLAGAVFVTRDSARDAIAALAEPWTEATRVACGAIARHAATTRAERRGAKRMLLQILIKHEDSAVTRYFYRPLSRPLTRLLVDTAIAPNHISILVAAIGLVGCWFAAQAGQQNLVIGTALVLVAGIVDGCDGEIARLRLVTSKFGAWLDTVVDELTTMGYFIAVGLHVYANHPEPWVPPLIALGALGIFLTVYVIYYFLIHVSKTGNSQHYIGDLVQGDGGDLHPRPRAVSTFPPWARKIGYAIMLVIRRDFINLGSLVVALALAHGDLVIFGGIGTGGVVTAAIIVPEHLRLRGQLRDIARRGEQPRLVVS
jgi:phosphatidylglycerophosphate synthase